MPLLERTPRSGCCVTSGAARMKLRTGPIQPTHQEAVESRLTFWTERLTGLWCRKDVTDERVSRAYLIDRFPGAQTFRRTLSAHSGAGHHVESVKKDRFGSLFVRRVNIWRTFVPR